MGGRKAVTPLAEFKEIMRNGKDFDHIHPTCTAAQLTDIMNGATPNCIPTGPIVFDPGQPAYENPNHAMANVFAHERPRHRGHLRVYKRDPLHRQRDQHAAGRRPQRATQRLRERDRRRGAGPITLSKIPQFSGLGDRAGSAEPRLKKNYGLVGLGSYLVNAVGCQAIEGRQQFAPRSSISGLGALSAGPAQSESSG
jgi:hypothetical protein